MTAEDFTAASLQENTLVALTRADPRRRPDNDPDHHGAHGRGCPPDQPPAERAASVSRHAEPSTLWSRERIVVVPAPQPEDDRPEQAEQQLAGGADRPLDG